VVINTEHWADVKLMTVICSVFATIRDMSSLPVVHEQCMNILVEYIHEHYGGLEDVHAIVDPVERGHPFALLVATKLNKPHIPVQEAADISADQNDMIHETYINRENKVLLLFS